MPGGEDEVREVVQAFFEAWVERDFEAMLDICQTTWADKPWASRARLENMFSLDITGFVLAEPDVRRDGVVVDVPVRVVVGPGRTADLVARVLCERAPMRPDPEGEWGVNPVSVIRGLAEQVGAGAPGAGPGVG